MQYKTQAERLNALLEGRVPDSPPPFTSEEPGKREVRKQWCKSNKYEQFQQPSTISIKELCNISYMCQVVKLQICESPVVIKDLETLFAGEELVNDLCRTTCLVNNDSFGIFNDPL